MDVTEEILRNTMLYGASDNTAPGGLSSSRSLNYAVGGSIRSPELSNVSIIPFTLKYSDSVGLFGKENHFVKVNVSINPEVAFACFEEQDWECATIKNINDEDLYYNQAVISLDKEVYDNRGIDQGFYAPGNLNIQPPDYISDVYAPYSAGSGDDLDGSEYLDIFDYGEYTPANILANKLTRKNLGIVSIDLINLKTGNKYIDSWFDVRLYTADREEHPYDKMYVSTNDFFYIGFHARNTKRLPYNVECIIGNEYVSSDEMTDEDRRYIARRIR